MFGLAGIKLYGAIAGAVAVALFLAWVWRIDTLRARHLRDFQSAELRHSITTASLNACNGYIDAANKRVAEQAKRLESDKVQAASDLARADARWRAVQGTVSALERSARRTDLPACQVSPGALSALEGL